MQSYSRGKQPNKEYPTGNGESSTKLRFALDDRMLVLQPVAGGERDVETANPPAHLEPGRAAIGAKGEEAEEEAETKPAKEHH